MRALVKNLLLLTVFIAGFNAQATTSSNEFLDMSLEDLVEYRIMSMSRKEQRVADMAAAAFVITSDDIRRSGAQSIPEALRLAPGLNVAQISGSRWAVSSRGFNERFSTKLLVQVDGRSIYSPVFAGVLWETQNLIIDDIERIEIIRGPGAALWGTNAMNGVINIVTRSAQASQGSMISAVVGTGGQSSISMINAGQLKQGGHFKLGIKTTKRDGTLERGTGLTADDNFQHNRIGLRIEPRMDLGKLTIQTEIYENKSSDVWELPSIRIYSDTPNSYTRSALLSEKSSGIATMARFAWHGDTGYENELKISLDHDRTEHNGIWGTGTTQSPPFGQAPKQGLMGGKKTDFDIDFQRRRILGNHDLIWGLNVRSSSVNLEQINSPYQLADGKSRQINYSAFIHDEITITPDKLKIIAGSKFEKNALTGYNAQPNVRILFTPTKNEAYWGAISKSARSLGKTESLTTIDIAARDAHFVNPAIPLGLISAVTQVAPLPGAPIRPESALSIEAGWRKQYSNFLILDAAIFATNYKHLRGARMLDASHTLPGAIQALACLQSPTPDACYFTLNAHHSNAARATAHGAELSLNWHPTKWWDMHASYSFLSVDGKRTGDSLGDIQINAYELSAPRHQLALSNNFNLPSGLNLNLRVRHNSKTGHYTLQSTTPTALKSVTQLDARLAWRVDSDSEISLIGRNLLKSNHSEFININPMTRANNAQRTFVLQAVTRF